MKFIVYHDIQKADVVNNNYIHREVHSLQQKINVQQLLSLGDLVDGMGHITHIAWSKGHHRDAAVLCHEYTVLGLQCGHLLLVHARVAEHAYLFSDVRPVAGGTCTRSKYNVHSSTQKHHASFHFIHQLISCETSCGWNLYKE